MGIAMDIFQICFDVLVIVYIVTDMRKKRKED